MDQLGYPTRGLCCYPALTQPADSAHVLVVTISCTWFDMEIYTCRLVYSKEDAEQMARRRNPCNENAYERSIALAGLSFETLSIKDSVWDPAAASEDASEDEVDASQTEGKREAPKLAGSPSKKTRTSAPDNGAPPTYIARLRLVNRDFKIHVPPLGLPLPVHLKIRGRRRREVRNLASAVRLATKFLKSESPVLHPMITALAPPFVPPSNQSCMYPKTTICRNSM